MRLWKRKLIVAAVAAAVTPPVSGGDPYWDQLEHLIHFHSTGGSVPVCYDEVTGTSYSAPGGLGRGGAALYAGTANWSIDAAVNFGNNLANAIQFSTTNWETKDEWTVEFNAFFADVNAVQMPMSKGSGFQIYIAGGTLYLALSESNNTVYFLHGAIGTVPQNQRVHVAVQRLADGRYYGAINGNAVQMGNFPTKRPYGGGAVLTLGKYGAGNNYPMNGSLDEFRVSTVARYGAGNFAVPTTWHPDPDPNAYVQSKRYQSKCALYATFSSSSYNVSSGTGVKSVTAMNAERVAGLFGLYGAKFRGAASHGMEITTTDVLGSRNFAMEAFVTIPASTIATQYTNTIMCQYPQSAGAGSWIFGVREGKLTFWNDQTMYQGTQIVADGVRHHLKVCRHGYYLLGFVDDKLDMVVKFFASLGILDGGNQRKIQVGRWGDFFHPNGDITIEHLRMVVDDSTLDLAKPVRLGPQYSADADTAFFMDFDGSDFKSYQYRPTSGGELQTGMMNQAGVLSLTTGMGSWNSGISGQGNTLGGVLYTGDAGPSSIFKSMGSSDFTAELVFRRNASQDTPTALINNRNGPSNTGFAMSFNPALSAKVWYAGTDAGAGATADTVDYKPAAAGDAHIATIRKNNFLMIIVDGVIKAHAVCNQPMANVGGDLHIGGHKYGGAFDQAYLLAGIIDGVRISRVARYLSAKVPQAAYPHFA